MNPIILCRERLEIPWEIIYSPPYRVFDGYCVRDSNSSFSIGLNSQAGRMESNMAPTIHKGGLARLSLSHSGLIPNKPGWGF